MSLDLEQRRTEPPRPTLQHGAVTFAGMMLILVGTFHVVQGVVALVDDQFYATTRGYSFELDLTTWGWVHLVAGVAIGLCGAAVLARVAWAPAAGVVLAGLSILASFLWLPHYPLWGLTVMAFDAFVIWALAAHGSDTVRG